MHCEEALWGGTAELQKGAAESPLKYGSANFQEGEASIMLTRASTHLSQGDLPLALITDCIVQALGAVVATMAKQHKCSTAAVSISDGSWPMKVWPPILRFATDKSFVTPCVCILLCVCAYFLLESSGTLLILCVHSHPASGGKQLQPTGCNCDHRTAHEHFSCRIKA